MSEQSFIKVEARVTYELHRAELGWTDEEWTEALEAAIRGDVEHEAWVLVYPLFVTVHEIQYVGAGVDPIKEISS